MTTSQMHISTKLSFAAMLTPTESKDSIYYAWGAAPNPAGNSSQTLTPSPHNLEISVLTYAQP